MIIIKIVKTFIQKILFTENDVGKPSGLSRDNYDYDGPQYIYLCILLVDGDTKPQRSATRGSVKFLSRDWSTICSEMPELRLNASNLRFWFYIFGYNHESFMFL